MFGAEEEPSGLDRSEGGDASRAEVGAKAHLWIGVVERSPVTIDRFPDGGAITSTWSEASVKVRNRKPVSNFIDCLLDEVLCINNTHKSEQVGWRTQDGETCPLTLFKIVAGAVDHAHRARMLELIASVPEILTSAEIPDAKLPWLSPVARERVLKKVDEVLLTCGGRALTASIDITVDNLVVGTLSGTYGPKPNLEKLDPKAETFIGRVTNTFSDPPGFEIREIDSTKKRTIRADMAALDHDQINAWRGRRQLIAVDVQTTITTKGKINHELVQVQEANS